MAKLTRVTGKVFGSQASPTGDVDNGAYIGQFGSAQAGTYVGTDDVAMIQNLPAWEQGWIGACVEEDQLPPLPERTGVDKVLSYQECYLLQQGMPEWDSATTYYINNFCSYKGIIYKSLTDINLNNQPDTSVANWEVYGKISQYTKFAINKGSTNLLYTNSAPLYWKRNITEEGTLTTNDSIISGFSSSNYATISNSIDFTNASTWKICLKGVNSSSFANEQIIFENGKIGGIPATPVCGCEIKITTSGKINCSLGFNSNYISLVSITTLSINTDYDILVEFTGQFYNLYINGTLESQIENSNKVYYTSTYMNKPYIGRSEQNPPIYSSNFPATYTSINLKGSFLEEDNNYIWQGIIAGTSLDYDYMESAGTQVLFDIDNTKPLTYTNIMGTTRTVESLDSIDVSGTSDGTYKVVLPENGSQSYLFDGNVYIEEKINTTKENFTNIGGVTINNSVASGFATTPNPKYISAKPFQPTNTWEMVRDITIGNDVSTQIINSVSNINSGKSNVAFNIIIDGGHFCLHINIVEGNWTIECTGTHTVQANTHYLIKAKFTGTKYILQYSTDNGENWITDAENSTTIKVYSDRTYNMIGGYNYNNTWYYPFLGSVNLKNCYDIIDDKIVWQGYGDIINSGDVWIDPQELYTAQQYDGADWQDFNDVVLLDSSVTVGSGVITDLEQPYYNNSHITPNKNYISGLSMPSDKYENLTLLSSGSEYTAPANGYFVGCATDTSGGSTARFFWNNIQISCSETSGNLNSAYTFCPVSKGQKVKFYYKGTTAPSFIIFIYVNGEV